MADPRELPDQAKEFVDLSKRYVDEEILQPARQLGAFAGKGIGAGILFAVGGVLLAAGVLALALMLLPDGETWQALGYVGTGLLAAMVAGLLLRKATRDGNDR